MPTLLALLLASCAAFLVSRLPLPPWAAIILATVLWLVVYIATRRLLRALRP
jgi:hypothetical protein